MAESSTRSYVVKCLQSLHATPIESASTGSGIPDVFYIGGVIECKWLRKWPMRTDTPVKLTHPLTTDQYKYLLKHVRLGGSACAVLQANRHDWFIFDTLHCHILMPDYAVTVDQLKARAFKYWTRKPTRNEFLNAIREIHLLNEQGS